MKIQTILLAAFSLFTVMTAQANNHNKTNNKDKDKENVITDAQFMGGHDSMQQYIDANLAYPACALEEGMEGTVEISFFVLPDGSIYNAKVLKGITNQCDQAALKIVENMPGWEPATKNGMAVASKAKIAINFRLEG